VPQPPAAAFDGGITHVTAHAKLWAWISPISHLLSLTSITICGGGTLVIIVHTYPAEAELGVVEMCGEVGDTRGWRLRESWKKQPQTVLDNNSPNHSY
jgi:hypothetical protein